MCLKFASKSCLIVMLFCLISIISCTKYIRPTGRIDTYDQVIQQDYIFDVITKPTVESPKLVVRYASAPLIRQTRKIEYLGKKSYKAIGYCIGVPGLAITIIGCSKSEKNQENNKLEITNAGRKIAYTGLAMILTAAYFMKPDTTVLLHKVILHDNYPYNVTYYSITFF